MPGRSIREGDAGSGSLKRAGLRKAAQFTEDARVRRLLLCAARFFTGWLLAGAVIFEGTAPFAAGFTAVSGGGAEGACALAGAVLGAVMKGGLQWAVRVAAVCLLVFVASAALKRVPLMKKNWFMPLVTSFLAACVGFVYVAESGFDGKEIVFTVMELVLAGSSAAAYRLAFLPAEAGSEQSRRRRIAICASVCTVLIALSDLKMAELISIGRVLAVLCVLSAAWKGGAAAGAAAGVCLGLAMDMASGEAPLFCAALGAAGAVSGLFAGNPRIVAAIVYDLVNLLLVVWGRGERLALASLYETFLASAIFLLLPDGLLTRAAALLRQPVAAAGEDKLLRYLRRRAERSAGAFTEVFRLLGGEREPAAVREENVQTVFDAVAERKCIRCPQKELCYGMRFEETRCSQNDAAMRLLLRGHAEKADFSGDFLSRCRDPEGYLRLVNEEYAELLRRRARQRQPAEGPALMRGRFRDLARILEELAVQLTPPARPETELRERLSLWLRGHGLDLDCGVFRDGNGRLHVELDGDGAAVLRRQPDWQERLSAACSRSLCELKSEATRRHVTLLEAEPLAVRIGVASMRRDGEAVSGDKGAYFKTDGGLLHVLLSDGMGSGEAAAEDSALVVSLLERFLRAGIGAETAVRLLGAAMLLRSEEEFSSASVDLLSLDLFTGRAELFKFGAAPTFIRNGDAVEMLQGESLSAGLRGRGENQPDKLSARLLPGDAALIVSDGVTAGADPAWLMKALAAEKKPGRDFAQRLLRRAEELHGCEDDMTVITVCVEKR